MRWRFSLGARSRGTLSVLLVGLGLVALPSTGRAQVSDEARRHFEAGVNYLQDPGGARYEEAYLEFKRAYEASQSWKVLGNLGLTAMKLERDGEAIAAYEKYLAMGAGELDPDEHAQIERDLNTLRASAATLNLTVEPAAAHIVDERLPVQGAAVRNQYGVSTGNIALSLRPGRHRLVISADGFEPATFEVALEPGSKKDVSIALRPPATESTAPALASPPPDSGATVATHRPIPIGAYIGLAATGAFAVGAGVTGVIALGKASDYDEVNDGSDPATADDLRGETKTFNLLTDVFIGAAVVSAGVTTYLYLSRPEKPVQADTGRLRVSPLAGPSGGGVAVSGRF